MMFKLPLLRVVVIDGIKEVGIIVVPFLKCKLLAKQSWSHVVCYEGSLDEQCARAAHGINEISLSLPSCHEYHSRSQHLIEWCLHALLSVAASVQALAA